MALVPIKSALLVLFLKLALAYREEYRGFDSCGIGGWHCISDGGDFEVSYQCSTLNMNARLWVWTARIPSVTTKLSVVGCAHVEIHMDCTTGYRSYTMRQFRVADVKHLEFLRPLEPHVFLHDNDEVSHAPPEMLLTNVSKITWYPRMFEKAGGRCRTKQQVLRRLTFDSVNLTEMRRGTFRNLTLESLSWNKVNFGSVESGAVSVNSDNVSISNSSMSVLSPAAFQLQGDTISLEGNQIENISENGILIRARHFEFRENAVMVTESGGFDVLARVVRFYANKWNRLETGSFSKVQPGDKSSSYKKAEKFTFEFVNNTVLKLSENALHPDYKAYNEVCSKIIVEGNILECHCQVPFEDPENNKSRRWWDHYYRELALTESNTCIDAPQCSLLQALTVLHQSCQKSTNLSALCVNLTVTVMTTEITTEAPTLEPTFSTTEKTNSDSWTHQISVTLKPNFSQNTNTVIGYSATTLLTIIATFLILIALAGLAFWFNIHRNKSAIKVVKTYERERGTNDDDDDDQEHLIAERVQVAIHSLTD